MKIIGPIIAFILLVFLLYYLVANHQSSSRSTMQKSPRTVTIDHCQYLESETYYGYLVWSHKGNCTNHTK